MSAGATRAARLRSARWTLAAALFGATMAIGAVHVQVLAAVALAIVASVVLSWGGADSFRARESASLVLWTGVALTAWTALAVVPVPAGLLARIAPSTADIWSRSLAPLGLPGPGWATLSLDPFATRVQVLRGVAYVLAFLAASRICVRREGAAFLERALIVTAVALAAAAFIHPALGAEKVFGLYVPRRDPGVRHVAPILNPNVLASYLNIGLALTLGQLLSPRPTWPRSLLAALAAVLVGSQVWVASRGGVLSAVVCVVLVVWLSRSKGPESDGIVRRFLPAGVLLLAGVGMIVISSSEEVVGELASADTSKLDVARDALRMVPTSPVFGVGRGAFESAFPAFRTDTMHMVYTHPENVVAQWTTEWGVPVSVMAFVVLLFALRPASAMVRSPRAAGAWSAVVCVAIQNLVDFGSEYPAVVLALTVCAAIVTGGTRGTDEPRRLDAWAAFPARLIGVSVASAIAALVLALPTRGEDLFDDRARLHAAALDPRVTRSQFEALAASAMLRHPAEPYLPFTGALRAVRTGESSLLPWIERTLDRAIVYGPAHLLLARWLTARSPSQARLEYRLAVEQAPELGVYVAPAVPALVRGYEDAVELIPRGPGRAAWVNLLSSAVVARLPATARRLDELIVGIDPNDHAYLERRAREGLADVVEGATAPWCAGVRRAECIHDALARADRLRVVVPGRCAAHSIHARLLLESGDPQAAVRELRGAADAVVDRTACYEDLAGLAALAGANDAVSFALERVGHAGCAEDSECVQNLRFVAAQEAARGNHRSALAALQRARAKAPDDDALLEQVAALAGRVDLHVEAMRAYQSLATRHPADPRWPEAIEAERAKVVMGPIPY